MNGGCLHCPVREQTVRRNKVFLRIMQIPMAAFPLEEFGKTGVVGTAEERTVTAAPTCGGHSPVNVLLNLKTLCA
jgi:hypothetical protein